MVSLSPAISLHAGSFDYAGWLSSVFASCAAGCMPAGCVMAFPLYPVDGCSCSASGYPMREQCVFCGDRPVCEANPDAFAFGGFYFWHVAALSGPIYRCVGFLSKAGETG